MAMALAPPSSNTKHWWPRLSPSKEPSSLPPTINLYDGPRSRPHTVSGTKPSLMNSVTTPNATSSNAFTPKSSRFNLAAVIGFGSKSKRQQHVDLSDPPSQIRSLPTPKPSTHREWGTPHSSTNPRLSHGIASSGSGASRTSTDGPLTPADIPSSPSSRTSYQHSLMTLTDLPDPFASAIHLDERRSSAHSDKSLRRFLQKIDGKTPKTSTRLPMGDASKKDSRARSTTLPSRASTSTDASEAYQSLRAVEPPWATSDHSEPHSKPLSAHRAAPRDNSKTVRGFSGAVTLRQSKSSKPTLPWPPSPPAREKGSLQLHQRTHSSSSISKQYVTDSTRTHTRRPSTSSSVHTSPSSLTSPSHLSFSSGSPVDEPQVAIPSLGRASPASIQTMPTSIYGVRTNPRPPPTTGLPPTPTLANPSSLLPPSTEERPLRSRSGTTASSISFASSLSSLSFDNRPSPQDPPVVGADGYPSLLNETLPVPGVPADHVAPRRNRNPTPSGDSNVHVPTPTPTSPRNDNPPNPPKAVFPGTRPLPSPPVNMMKRDRTLSVTSPTSDAGRTLRKQRSFHNTSLRAPTYPQPSLRHHNSYSSLDPSARAGDHARSPPLLPLRSPPLPPPQDMPPLPPPPVGTSKHNSPGKDSGVTPSPRRKLFGTNRHDRQRDRERKQELDNVDTSVPASAASPRHGSASSSGPALPSSSWYDDRGAGSEPPSASSSASPSTMLDVAQHIVPPAELLRLGAKWERENESRNGLRTTKSSWGSQESNGSHTSLASSRAPIQSSGGEGSSPAPTSSSMLPRSASLLSKASSTPSFSRARGPPLELSFGPAVPPDSHTSLSPPPPRRQRTISRPSQQVASSALPPPPPLHGAPSVSSATMPPKGALVQRKPSFLDMTTSRQSVTIDVPDPTEREEYERDSFLELSRGMNSIETIRESVSSMDSFMQ
ncbi:hypothetical protein JB92DRAFT_1817334 [Gautieria morchelliformis]|nr:hypothetical protein JB92DRAFT_1817334 [Gautieria morchelliformis]